MDLSKVWQRQADFTKKFVPGLGSLTQAEKQKHTKDYILYIIDELMELSRNLSWKTHRKQASGVMRGNILEELVDIEKYWMCICQFWEISPEELASEFLRKTEVVEQRFEQEFANPWDPTKYSSLVVLDIDGVIANYPDGFLKFVSEKTGVEIPLDGYSEVYAHVGKYVGHEQAYDLKHQFREQGLESLGLDPVEGAPEFVRDLEACGTYILLMTSRPYKKYRRIMADTIQWLKNHRIPYHSILFEEDKEDRIIKDYAFARFVVEDTLSNAKKISSKGIPVCLRDLCYNQGPLPSNVKRFKDFQDLRMLLETIP